MNLNGTWGDGLMLSAAANYYDRPVEILSDNGSISLIDVRVGTSNTNTPIRLGYFASSVMRPDKLDSYASLHERECINNKRLLCQSEMPRTTEIDVATKKTKLPDTTNKITLPENIAKGDLISRPNANSVQVGKVTSGLHKLSTFGFSINPKKITPVSHLETLNDTVDTASTSNSNTSNQQVNLPPSASDGVIVTNQLSEGQQNKQAQIGLQTFPTDISKSGLHSPIQPKLNVYPWKYYGINKSVKRRFQSCFYAEFPWLEYSVQQDAAYCFCCRYWGKENSPFAEPTGFSDWQHATGQKYGLTLHNLSVEHLRCLVDWDQFKIREKEGKQVVNLIDKAAVTQREQNRYYIKTLAEAILFCAKQEIALRGHDESDDSESRGNFLELVNVISRHDDKFAARLRSLPDNATYLSPAIQNDLAQCMATCISDVVSNAVKEAGMFSLLVDDTKDISKTEQTSIVLRYFDKTTNSVNERFLGFFQPNGLDA